MDILLKALFLSDMLIINSKYHLQNVYNIMNHIFVIAGYGARIYNIKFCGALYEHNSSLESNSLPAGDHTYFIILIRYDYVRNVLIQVIKIINGIIIFICTHKKLLLKCEYSSRKLFFLNFILKLLNFSQYLVNSEFNLK